MAGATPTARPTELSPPWSIPVVVGIDPGKRGGVVAVGPSRAIVGCSRAEATYCPGGKEYRPKEMAATIAALNPTLVILERQHAMPKQGGTSMLTIGIGFGIWVGICAALGVPYEVVSAASWQKEILRGVAGEGKERAIRAVEARVPGLNLTPGRVTKPHLGLADAACLALYGLARLGRPPDAPADLAREQWVEGGPEGNQP